MDVPTSGRWRVTGEAGSGVSSFLVDAVVEKLRSGADPDGVLVITASKEAASRLREQLHESLIAVDSSYVSNAPLVRPVHSLAFALVRSLLDEHIRLITGAEQDGVIRDLLAGHAEDHRGDWPSDIRPALTFVGFARQLRDFLLRAVERGLSPEDLEELGRKHSRPLWAAAGRFLREYEQTMALTGTHNYSASELVSTVLELDLPRQWHTVVVDDAQHLDPKSGELITRILPTGSEGLTIVGGDLAQSVYHFRGATTDFFTSFSPDEGKDLNLGASRRRPTLRVVEADSASTNQAVVADTVRRAHLVDDLAWQDIAVIVRSTADIGPVRRGLLAAGVPVHINPTDVVLAEQHLVSALLLGLHALDHELSRSQLEQLLLGPVGGADPVTLRRLLRGLRRHDQSTRGMDTLAGLIAPGAELPDLGDVLTEREHDILVRLRTVLDAGRAALESGGSVEEVLWAVWSTTSLADRLVAAALRGGANGSQADRDLDAVMALFDAAGDFVERHPGTGSISSFVTHIREQELPTGVRDRRSAAPEAVAVHTAHGVVGKQYRLVVVAGVQENTWPSLGETGSLFGQEDLLDLIDRDIDPAVPVSHTAARLAEERRLFHVATTRATDHLVVTTVNNLEASEPVEPSRFIAEFASAHGLAVEQVSGDGSEDGDAAEFAAGVRILSRSSLIAELRRALISPDSRDDVRAQAARQLARLANAQVPGADPSQWASATTASTDTELAVRSAVSPSRIEALINCPLNAVVGRVEDDADTPLAVTRGTLAHAYLEALGRGVDPEYARLLTVDAFRAILDEPEWKVKSEVEGFTTILDRTRTWLENSRSAFTQLGVETDVDVNIIDDVSIVGRLDRLEIEKSGAVHIVDLKTAKSAVSKQAAEDNLQLMAYQLALSRGILTEHGTVATAGPDDEPLTVGGGVLVYPASSNKSIPIRQQAPKSAEALAEFAETLPGLVEDMRGPQLTARICDSCRHCRIKPICPIQPEGKSVTHG